MDIKISQTALLAAVAVVEKIPPSNSTLPVLGSIVIAAAPGKVEFKASRLDISAVHVVSTDDDGDLWIGKSGSIALPARAFGEIIRLMRGNIRMRLDSMTMTLEMVSGTQTMRVKGIHTDEFPLIPPCGGLTGYLVDADTFIAAIKGSVYAAGVDENRPALNSVNMIIKRDGITLAATDGFRLGVQEITTAQNHDGSDGSDYSVLVPRSAALEVARVISLVRAEQVGITLRTRGGSEWSAADFAIGENTVISCSLIDANAPNWRNIIPTSETTRIEIKSDDVVRHLRGADPFARDSSFIVRMEISRRPSERIVFTASSPETGDYTGLQEIGVKGADLNIAFNGRYLREAAEAVGGTISMSFSKPTAPTLIKSASDETDGRGQLHVIMPMHINK